ncbi:MAG: tellurium resistance protein [Actinomycetota bacterium]|nr:tellurium resistance protein [Actinomycetota bacterium]
MSVRPLHFIWMLDCSGSMSVGGKIQALNTAIAEALPAMVEVAAKNLHADLLVRAITFSTGARWHVADPTPIESFVWRDVGAPAGGLTDLGAALSLVADVLTVPPMPARAFPPVIVLVTDGRPTDAWKESLQRLLEIPWGAKAVRMAIAIGRDANHSVLQEFIGRDSGRRPLHAGSPEDLAGLIRWTSTVVVRQASQPVPHEQHSDPLTKPPPPMDLLVWGDVSTKNR